MAISTATYISDTVLFIRNLLRDNISDPNSRSSGFIMTSFPKRQISYPVIVVKVSSSGAVKLGMQSEISQSTIVIEIDVFAKNSKQSDELTQEVIDTLRTNQLGTGSTNENDIHGFQMTSLTPIVFTEGNATVHRKNMTFSYFVILS